MDDLLDTAPCGFLAFADDGTIALINSTLLRMLGYSSTELEGRRVEALLPAASRIFFRTYFFPRLQLHGSLEEVYLLLRDRDGADLPVLINAVRRERAGSVLNDCVIVSMRQRGLLEDELLKARKIAEEASHTAALARAEAERANTAKSAFLASMSHELRTPLNAIIGFTGILLMRLPGPLTADQEKQLGTIQVSAKHLLTLINDLLDLAKIEAGRIELEAEPVGCQAVIEEIAAGLRPQAEQKGLRFVVDVPAEPLVVRADRRALCQILINLVNNAIKFTDAGEVRVELDHQPPTADCLDVDSLAGRRSSVVVRVRDTGIGITREDQARLFQAFERVGAAEARLREGTGLGLRISQQLARLLGGRIDVQSEPGVGSTFTLVLPGDTESM